MKLVDAYGHVSLPRQMSAEAFVRVMDENDVEQALICTAETCPDLGELWRGTREFPDRVRAAGLPVGATAQERLDGIRAQMEAGFVGIRIGSGLVAREPELLDAIGEAGGIPILVGGDAYRGAAAVVLEFLRKWPGCWVWGAHFGEPRDAKVLDEDEEVRTLLAHERFAVICSRHGGQRPELIKQWAKLLVERVGWGRLLFGSEYPVASWRNELYAETAAWMLQFGPSEGEREAYLRGNAQRMLFARPAPKVRPLAEKWTRFVPDPKARVALFPTNTLDVPEDVHQKLLRRYLAEPKETRGRYGDFIVRVLSEAVG